MKTLIISDHASEVQKKIEEIEKSNTVIVVGLSATDNTVTIAIEVHPITIHDKNK